MTDTVLMENHLSSEQIAAFVDGRLPESARLEAITHFADCDECRELFDVTSDAVAAGVTAEQAQVVPFRPRRKWPAIAAVAAVAAIAIVSLPPTRYEISDYRTAHVSELARASENTNERKIEGRLVGGFAHKDFVRNRGTGDEEDISYAVYKSVAYKLDKPNPTSIKAIRAKAIAKLVLGPKSEAVELLEQALRKDNDNATLLNDLSVAYLERGKEGDDQLALAAAQRAFGVKQTPESAWNIALAYTYMHKDAEAIAAWQEYLRLDPKSPWSDEARKKLHDLQNPL